MEYPHKDRKTWNFDIVGSAVPTREKNYEI